MHTGLVSARIGAASLARLLPSTWRDGGPAYSALADAIRLVVLDGRLPLDVRLPSERELAGELALSRTTVTAAYERLRGQGFLVSRQGAGSWTAIPPGARALAPDGPVLRPPGHGELGEGVVDLATATFPAGPEVHAAYSAALDALPRYLPGSGYDPQGLGVLREAIAAKHTARGLPTTADDIVVTSGAQHSVALAMSVLVSPGDRVLVEHPTYPNALESVRRAGGRRVPVTVGGEAPGWDMAAIAATLRQATPVAGYVIPDFHNPTGSCMTAGERGDLVRAAAATRTVLVVDESLVDLWIGRPPPPPVGALAPTASVVTVGGLSKSFWAGLRIGWIRADRSVVRRIVTARMASDLGGPVLEQVAAAHLMTSPEGERALDERRARLRRYRRELGAALRRHVPGWQWREPEGGLSLWARLDGPVSSAMVAAAPGYGLRLAAGTLFGLDGAFDQYLRVPLTPQRVAADEIAARLAALQTHVLSTSGRDWGALTVA